MNLSQESEQHYSLFWHKNFKKILCAAMKAGKLLKCQLTSTKWFSFITFFFLNDAAPKLLELNSLCLKTYPEEKNKV